MSTSKNSRRFRVNRGRRGLTLVEMLVAMTVSLIMIYGMVEFFAILSNQVSDGRAVIEMAGQQRAAALRLQSDLDGATAPPYPWLDPELGLGYTEIREGWGFDLQPILSQTLFNGTQVLPNGYINAPSSTVQDTAFGDLDDTICLTTRSPQQPHVATWRRRRLDGTFESVTLQGPDAEVIWFSLWQDPDGDGVPQPQDTKLYRRPLLIVPALQNRQDNAGQYGGGGGVNIVSPVGVVDRWTRSTNDLDLLLQDFIDFYNYNDISTRAEIHQVGTQIEVTMWANSLADLTKRENRFCHRPLLNLVDPLATSPTVASVVTDEVLQGHFPFEMYRNRPSEAGFGVVRNAGAYDPVTLFPDLTWLAQRLDRTGNDVVASHMVGFDIKVFDPTAWVIADTTPKWAPDSGAFGASSTLVPSDPGYATATSAAGANSKRLAFSNATDDALINNTDVPHVSRGAFVDLNYWRYLYNAPAVNALPRINARGVVNDLENDIHLSDSLYGPPPAYFRDLSNLSSINRRTSGSPIPSLAAGWRGLVTPTWDTWPTHYENNEFNEDFDVNEPSAADPTFRNKTDQGDDGFDDDNTNGVDDAGERETSPPYLANLSSIQVTLRMVENDSRQVRQISVIHDFGK